MLEGRRREWREGGRKKEGRKEEEEEREREKERDLNTFKIALHLGEFTKLVEAVQTVVMIAAKIQQKCTSSVGGGRRIRTLRSFSVT